MIHRFHFALGAGLALMLCVAGCDSNPSTAQVDVTLTYQGEPLSDVVVTFNPVDGGRPAVGKTNAEGKVTGLSTFKPNDGVVPGEHVITLSKPTEVQENLESADAYATPTDIGFPQKYMAPEVSDLKMTVKLGEPNQQTFELKD